MNESIREIAEEAFTAGIYKKNISFIYDPGADPEEFSRVKLLGGSPAQSGWMIQQAHRKVGVQMHVSKEVSNDLQDTDFSDAARIEDVPWMAPVVEVYFEDPRLPTALVMKTDPQTLQKWFPDLDVQLADTEYITVLMQEGSDIHTAKQLSLQIKPDMYEAFLTKADVPDMQQGIFSSALTDQDNNTICYMLHLVLKVFAFASLPVYKPAPLTKKQMHFGGKPHIKGRPERPAFRTAYLPRVVITKMVMPTDGEMREFHGRRGHLRYYMHERYTARQGTWDFIQPVADPETGKYPPRKTFKVRKV